MKRRYFLQHIAASACALPSLVLAACRSDRPIDHSPKTPGSVHRFELGELSIDDLRQKLENGTLTSRRIVELYLRRIREIDQQGIALKSVIEVNPDALTIAEQCDDDRRNKRVKSPLHGIPFLVKDNIDTADSMMTTAGSLALSGHHARIDAPIVRQLRDAGAILLGKTNLSEWANFRSTRSSSGWSSRGGQTRNPYILDRNPCGSSSGSAVAVAAGLCAFAIGTETNGSISCPASINGVVGLKPTVGLLSRSGIIPISKTQDTAGPMTRTVRDAAIVLGTMTAFDDTDTVVLKRPQAIPSDYTLQLDSNALEGRRIGVERSFLKVHEKVDALLKEALDQMRLKGATIVEVDFVERLKKIGESEYELLQFEFKDGLNRYLSAADAPVKSLKEVIAFNNAHADQVMPFFGQEILEASEQRKGLDSPEYQKVLNNVLTTARQAIDSVMKANELDVLCGPATGPAWCTDVVNGDAFSGYGMGSGAAMAGYPSITVPMGEVHGLPVGMLFIGGPFTEAELLAIAYAYEQASHNRKAPSFRAGTFTDISAPD